MQGGRVTWGLAVCLGVLAPATGVAGQQHSLGDPAIDQALRQAGWEVRREEGRGLLLYPPQTARESAEVTSNEKPPAGSAPTPDGAVPRTRPDWDRLRTMGWRVEEGADRSTLLYPPLRKAEGGVSATAPAAIPDRALDALLQERGWRVERDGQGGLLLYPLGAAPAGSDVTPVPGVETAPVREAAVTLPVDRWTEARTIADAWLAERGAPGWRVGKIRQVHRVYLVSIVDGARPPNLVHQIAITSGNGLVVVLN
jgi:hypothetical protein